MKVAESGAMRVLTIFTRFGTEKYPTAERELDDLFRTQLPDVDRDVVVVDTAIAPGHVEQSERRILIGSDNESWEFSAVDTALALVGSRLWAYDLINIATSAFRQLHTGYLPRFRPTVLEAIAGRAVCLGHIDCYNDPVRVLDFVSQHWMRTSCFFLPPTELGILGTVQSAGSRERWFSGDPSRPFREDAPLSMNFQRLIIDWLTGRDTGQGVTWHSGIVLDRDRLTFFEQKALTILNEHLLSARLRAAGCRLIDVTWLASGSLYAADAVDWQTPWWDQTANRDADVVRVAPGLVVEP
jgi:hypothetical protein